jgi:endonuclease YncB( thermonuclease family)
MRSQNGSARWHRIILTAILATGAPIGTAAAWAQGLDMDSNASTPAPAPAPATTQAGSLDLDTAPPTAAQPTVAAPASPPADTAAPVSAPQAAPPATTVPTTVVEVHPTEPKPVILDHPTVIDTARLQSGGTTVTLFGIEGLPGPSAQGLQGFLSTGSGQVTCQAQGSSGGTPQYVCLMPDGTDVAQVALVNGAAKTTSDAPESYRGQETAAQAARRGIWVNLPPPPEAVTHPVVRNTATLSAAGKTYALDGIVGFEAPYATQLQGYITGSGDTLTCSAQAASGDYICLLPDGTDVAKVALVNGAARVGPNAPDAYRVQQLDALNNRRGYWATASDAVITAALLPVPGQQYYSFVTGDDGTDGITYVGGAPVAMIDGEEVFLILGAAGLGWGYYDHYHHWHGAPDRFRHHMEAFHPEGRGLRGYDRAAFERGPHGPYGMGPHEAYAGGPHGSPEMMRAGGVHPGMPGTVARTGMGVPAGRPSMAMAAARPTGAPAGFMRPAAAASAGGFHPAAAPAMMRAAPAPVRVAAPSGGGGRHK